MEIALALCCVSSMCSVSSATGVATVPLGLVPGTKQYFLKQFKLDTLKPILEGVKKKAFKKYSKKQPFFQQQKITKKLEITWTVFRYPGGQGYLFRFRPDFVAFTRGRALSRGGRFLFYREGERERKVNAHARCVSFFYKLIPSKETRELGEGNKPL